MMHAFFASKHQIDDGYGQYSFEAIKSNVISAKAVYYREKETAALD